MEIVHRTLQLQIGDKRLRDFGDWGMFMLSELGGVVDFQSGELDISLYVCVYVYYMSCILIYSVPTYCTFLK